MTRQVYLKEGGSTALAYAGLLRATDLDNIEEVWARLCRPSEGSPMRRPPEWWDVYAIRNTARAMRAQAARMQ